MRLRNESCLPRSTSTCRLCIPGSMCIPELCLPGSTNKARSKFTNELCTSGSIIFYLSIFGRPRLFDLTFSFLFVFLVIIVSHISPHIFLWLYSDSTIKYCFMASNSLFISSVWLSSLSRGDISSFLQNISLESDKIFMPTFTM